LSTPFLQLRLAQYRTFFFNPLDVKLGLKPYGDIPMVEKGAGMLFGAIQDSAIPDNG
jgi:hypothetical protein